MALNLDSSNFNQSTNTYSNVTTINGSVIAAKLIKVANEGASVDLASDKDDILLNSGNHSNQDGKNVDFRLEFYDQLTGQPVAISDTAIFGDLDAKNGTETVTVKADDYTAISVASDTSLVVTNNGGLIAASGSEENDYGDDDAKVAFSFADREFIEFTLTTRAVNSAFTIDNDPIHNAVTTPLTAVVDGENTGEIMTPGYNDANAPTDGGGDIIDGADGINDIILGNGGNDTIDAGLGDDIVSGGSGDDIIDGNVGNDVIYGDKTSAITGDNSGRESFSWLPLSEHQIDSSVVQNTGSLEVTYTRVKDTGHHESSKNDEIINVSNIDSGVETPSNISGLSSVTNGKDNEGDFKWDFSEAVSNVSFNIADVDQNSIVKVTAFDAAGNEIDVDLTSGAKVDLIDTDGQFGADTGQAEPLYDNSPADPASTINVSIQGPVSSILVEHTQYGTANSGIIVSDIYFDALNDVVDTNNAAGDDHIEGGEGNDVIYGDNGPKAPEEVRESFSFVNGLHQQAGTVSAKFYATDNAKYEQGVRTDAINTSGIESGDETVNTNSSYLSWLNGHDNKASYALDFSEAVSNISFNITDIDQHSNVSVFAFDENWQPVQLTYDTVLPVDGNLTIQGSGEVLPTAESNTVTINVDSPAKYIQVHHTGQGGVYISDVYFVDPGAQVVDVTIDGEGGDDKIIGGEGADTMYGQGGDDTFIVSSEEDGAGDVIVGGNGPDQTTDMDILDLRGAGEVKIDANNDETDEGAVEGTVTFKDGSILAFSQIEKILHDDVPNLAPNAEDDSATGVEDTAVVTPVADLLANDTDPEGKPLTIISVQDPVNGTVALINGEVIFSPDADYNGPASYTYTVSDGEKEDSATVNLTIAPVNDDPVANDDFYGEFVEGQPIAIDVATILSNDSDPDGDAIRADAVISSVGGNFAFIDGVPSFVPDDGFIGDATLTYQITDDKGGFDTATITFKMIADPNPNQNPIAKDDDLGTFDVDTPAAIDVAKILSNDVDPDGDTLTATEVVATENGQFAFIEGVPSFVPDAGFIGTASLTYKVEDGNGGSDTATIYFEFVNPNEAPVAVNDTLEGDQDAIIVTPVDILLGNDSDPDGDPLTVTSVQDAVNGSVALDTDNGTVIFIPADGYKGPASYTYTITDGNGGVATATVNLTIAELNEAPVANDDDVPGATTAGVPLVIATDEVLANDTDPNPDDVLTVTEVGNPVNGTVTLDGTNITFTPDAGYCGPASFTYVVTDTGGLTSSATVNLVIGDELIIGDNGINELVGTAGSDVILGLDANDRLLGQDGDDCLNGGKGDDWIEGGAGDDVIRGGRGSDFLDGGNSHLNPLNSGADTFVWKFDDILDEGNGREVDYVKNFGSDDVLDLADLLQDEQFAVGNNTNQILDEGYLNFEYDAAVADGIGGTVISVSALGSFNLNETEQDGDQQIVLEGLDLTAGNTISDADILTTLLNNNQLITDIV